MVRCVRITCLSAAALIFMAASALAQGPKGRSFGFGFEFGDPLAFTIRIWDSPKNSWDAALGESFLGSPYIHADYLWNFPDAFNSNIVSLYAGIGAAVGFGEKNRYVFWYRGKGHDYWYYDDGDGHNGAAFAVKGAFGLDVIPRRSPLEIFFEVDPLLGVSPGFGFDFMVALGLRFYP